MKNASKNLVWALLGAALISVIGMWSVSSFHILLSGPAGTLIALGQLAGLLAATCALLQFLLMGRIGWIEGPFGLDKLAIFHRLNGYATITLILIHPLLLAFGYGLNNGVNLVSQYLTFLTTYPDVWKAGIAELLFIGVVVSSIYIVRRHLAFEQWYWIHLAVYAAIILAFTHQLTNGSTFLASPVSRNIWIGLYVFVTLNVLYFRFAKMFINFSRFGFIVDEVISETPSTVSIYIRGRRLDRLPVRAGQFIMVRFLERGLWLEEHPFSLSALPRGNRLRITVKNIGDYTAKLQDLKPGTRVIVSGPFGSFTRMPSEARRRLYLAGGVGITPLRALIEAEPNLKDVALIYASRTAAESIFPTELDSLLLPQYRHNVYSDDKTAAGEHGRLNATLIERLVPDFRDREVYLCGPDAMMQSLINEFSRLDFPTEQLRYERFSLHRTPQS